MKKILSLIVSLVMFLTFTGCKERSISNETEYGTITNESKAVESQNSGKVLIACFSMPESDGIDALAGASRVVENGKVLGNTQWVANIIAEQTGGTLVPIITVQNYPGDHEALVDQGSIEKRENARPKLKTRITNMDEYDVVFIGYPIWWYTLPMPLYSFIEEYNLSGKTIIPFSTHGGSGFSGTIDLLSDLLPEADVLDNGFIVSRNVVHDSRDAVVDWLNVLRNSIGDNLL